MKIAASFKKKLPNDSLFFMQDNAIQLLQPVDAVQVFKGDL